MPMENGKIIVWMSRHSPIEKQIIELKRLFGENTTVLQFEKPFANAEEVVNRYRKMHGDEMVVVAPLSVIAKIVELGVKPLWAEMQLVNSCDPTEWDVAVPGDPPRYYRFIKFRRITGVEIQYEEL